MLATNLLICPKCKNKLSQNNNILLCEKCKKHYEIRDGIPIFIDKTSRNTEEKTSLTYWDNVWRQQNIRKHLKISRKKIVFYLELTGMLNKPMQYVLKNTANHRQILEIGCGGSQFLPYLAKKLKPTRIWGIDRSFESCQLAQEGLAETHQRGHIICGDMFQCPLRPQSFDFVYSFTVIHHFNKPEKALKIHAELTKPRGVLVCVIPNLEGIMGSMIDYLDIKTMIPISINDFYTWFEDLGFANIIVKPIGGLHPLLMLVQSYRPAKHVMKEEVVFWAYQYLLGLPLLMLNGPLLFRCNHRRLSPFILGVGIKEE